MRSIFYFFLSVIVLVFNSNAQITPANNKISVDVSTPPQNASFDYDSCFTIGKNLGMTQTGIFQAWADIEIAPMNYSMTVFNTMNWYYPMHNMAIDLTLAPIATNVLEVPSDLTTTAFSSTVMINRFKRLLDSIKAHIPNVTLSSLVIGSEHDIYFGSNATKWSEYTTFYNAVSVYAKTLWPGLKVATELTFDGLTTQNTFAQTLNTNSDYIGVSYYPLNSNFTVKPVSSIPTDFATLVGLYSSKPLCFYQYGYPSSTTCNSSNALQKQFITQTFLSWDVYHTNIKMIDFTWLHDLSMAQVNYFSTYYGINNPVFLEYIHTLGFRDWNGSGLDKPALNELRCQAKVRGYNNLTVANCAVTVLDKNKVNNSGVSVFPNPASSLLSIESGPHDFSKIFIYDVLGNKVDEMDFSGHINISHLSNGIYFIQLYDQLQVRYSTKIVVSR
ncbi:MAG: T9SS type A sorting domain-containing protein [Bacteroidetes bacterium]|nr:T9SS type A sorting domain-containing protein [Bacteroidota bacterium]